MRELWRPLVYAGLTWENYAVSNHGRVAYLGRPRKKTFDRNGYEIVSLSGNGMRATALVHHLVAEAFLGPRPEGHEAHHKDTDRTHNWAWNLEYVHADEHQTHNDHKIQRGEQCAHSKLTLEAIEQIKALAESGMSGAEIGRRFGISRQSIHKVLKGKTWRQE